MWSVLRLWYMIDVHSVQLISDSFTNVVLLAHIDSIYAVRSLAIGVMSVQNGVVQDIHLAASSFKDISLAYASLYSSGSTQTANVAVSLRDLFQLGK